MSKTRVSRLTRRSRPSRASAPCLIWWRIWRVSNNDQSVEACPSRGGTEDLRARQQEGRGRRGGDANEAVHRFGPPEIMSTD